MALLLPLSAQAEPAPETYEPKEHQAGRDVPWVPTPDILLEKMLDMARLTPDDYVIDLGSGDGRNMIAAARRGARGHGVEYNPDMVALSRRNAEKAGVADRIAFIHGDMFEFEIAEATVMPLFLLDDNLAALIPRFMTLTPGARIVVNGFEIPGWEADKTATVDGDCGHWCIAYLYIVPARVEGVWRMEDGTELRLSQEFQRFSGALGTGAGAVPVRDGRMDGDRISFAAGNRRFTGHVRGEAMEGDVEVSDAAPAAGQQDHAASSPRGASASFAARRAEPTRRHE